MGMSALLVNIYCLLLMSAFRRCCVSAWVATLPSGARHGFPRRKILSLSPSSSLLLRYRGGTAEYRQPSVFSTQATVSSSADSNASGASASMDSDSSKLPVQLSNIGGGFTPCQFGGLAYWDTSSVKKFRVIFVLGGPGAGKGTQSSLMEEHYPVIHLSVGQLLRDEQTKQDSPHRALIEQCLVAGKIVPVEISLQLVQDAMQQASAINGDQIIFLIDGFPRNFDNVSGWARVMPDTTAVSAVLVYQCPLPVLEQRILERAEQSGRSDDNLASVKKRFLTFETETAPVISTLRQAACQDNQWSVVDVRGDEPLEKVWVASQQVLNELIMHDVLTANAALLWAVETGNAAQYQQVCDDEWFATQDVATVMEQQEGTASPIGFISKAQLDFVSGKHVAVSYDRV